MLLRGKSKTGIEELGETGGLSECCEMLSNGTDSKDKVLECLTNLWNVLSISESKGCKAPGLPLVMYYMKKSMQFSYQQYEGYN